MSHASPARKERLRLRARITRTLTDAMNAQLRSEGACCGFCVHKGYTMNRKQMTCDLGSDFNGHAITRADQVCPRFQLLRKAAAALGEKVGADG